MHKHDTETALSAGTNLTRRSFVAGAALAVAALALPGCSSGSTEGDDSSNEKITVAYTQGGYPTAYTDDNGDPAGYEIDVLNLVSELLPEYEFSYAGVDQPAVFAGLSSGKYTLGLTNSFWTPERAENYLQPEENIGASILGFFTRGEFPDVNTLSDAAEAGLRLAPITAGDGNYYVVEYYNENNPDNQIELTATDDGSAFTEAFDWVAEGRYDFSLIPLQYWDSLVVADDGAFHEYNDGTLRFSIIGATKTWSFLANDKEEFADQYSEALRQLKDEGKLSELSVEHYGVDNFEYLTDETSNYSFL